MDAQKIAQRLYESFASDDLCEHPEIVDDVEDLADEYEDLKAENAKLRKLVMYMHRCYVRGHDWGPFGAPEKEFVEQRMRELGIEVTK
jgi:hypothetical protein